MLFVAVAGCLFLCLFSVCSFTAHTDCFRFIFRMLAGSDLLPGFFMEITAKHSWPRPESLTTHLCIKGLRSPCYIYHIGQSSAIEAATVVSHSEVLSSHFEEMAPVTLAVTC